MTTAAVGGRGYSRGRERAYTENERERERERERGKEEKERRCRRDRWSKGGEGGEVRGGSTALVRLSLPAATATRARKLLGVVVCLPDSASTTRAAKMMTMMTVTMLRTTMGTMISKLMTSWERGQTALDRERRRRRRRRRRRQRRRRRWWRQGREGNVESSPNPRRWERRWGWRRRWRRWRRQRKLRRRKCCSRRRGAHTPAHWARGGRHQRNGGSRLRPTRTERTSRSFPTRGAGATRVPLRPRFFA